ncbi:acyltransferase family protein [Dysgonomonas sp. 511]|uniref:acyltransferase family protein n=1 Tax=Dysgonomonas sp. 511 TaxID=2302930 RepID=UPI0013D17228|nr:heparan-alpha-glucosaminide N-acetyltransferase domain-containing protein [Dysgonomonas sp. 511]NDV78121.1 DUF1624 domain-containing protein [Dysgonomonas sp. 511]
MDTLIQPKQSSRILALDILRGITIAGMILVNNPGSWSTIYEPLKHADWHGLTPTDLVFPFFMFIMGISTYVSMKKFNFAFSKTLLFKIIKRTIIIFLIGLAMAWCFLSIGTYYSLGEENLSIGSRLLKAITNFENIRIMGVMQRLALTYCATALIGMLVKHKYIPHIIIGTLIGYYLILVFGDGFAAEDNTNSIVYIVDKAILGTSHLYRKGQIVDPEGLLSTLPAIAHVLIGFCCGKFIVETKDNHQRIEKLFIIGAIMTFAGFLFSYGCPINKKIWTPTFVLATCGLASLLLALLIWIIDIKGYKKWSRFFESFGVNPLFIYVFGGLFGGLLGTLRIPYDGGTSTLKGIFLNNIVTPYLDPYFGSLIYAILVVSISWLVGYILYKKKIYIKI